MLERVERQSGCVCVGVYVCVYTPGVNPVDSAPHPQSSLPAFDVNSLKLDLWRFLVTIRQQIPHYYETMLTGELGNCSKLAKLVHVI